MVPAGGVEGLALKVLHPWQFRIGGDTQRADAGHENARGQFGAVMGGHMPDLLLLVVFGLLHLAVEAHVWGDAELVGAALQVIPDFLLRSKHPRPARVGGKGIGIQMGGHIAGAARVDIVPPGAADIPGLFQHHEIVVARLLELNRHTQSGEPGAHHNHLVISLGSIIIFAHCAPPWFISSWPKASGRATAVAHCQHTVTDDKQSGCAMTRARPRPAS